MTGHMAGIITVVCAAWLVGFVACYVVDDALLGGQHCTCRGLGEGGNTLIAT